VFRLADPGSPTLIQDAGDADAIYVLMPMRCEPEVVDACPGVPPMNESAADTRSTIFPGLRYRDAKAAIAFLCDGLGFERHAVYEGENGTVMHAELSFGNGMIMLGSIKPNEFGENLRQPDEIGMKETQSPYLVVADARCGLPERQGGEVYHRARHPRRVLWRARLHLPRPGGASLEHRHLRSLEGRRRLSGSLRRHPPVDGARRLRMRRASPL